MIYITADLHLDHDNIIKYCNRPFSSSVSMATQFIQTIWDVTGPSDTLYVLGDFAWDRKAFLFYEKELRKAVRELIFIKGNHDYKQSHLPLALRLRHNHRKYFLCHYPLASLAPGYTNLHGHCHDMLTGQPTWRFDVGVDAAHHHFGEYRPFSIDELAELTEPFDRREEYGQ